jgi:hypothetical protein
LARKERCNLNCTIALCRCGAHRFIAAIVSGYLPYFPIHPSGNSPFCRRSAETLANSGYFAHCFLSTQTLAQNLPDRGYDIRFCQWSLLKLESDQELDEHIFTDFKLWQDTDRSIKYQKLSADDVGNVLLESKTHVWIAIFHSPFSLVGSYWPQSFSGR